MKDAIGTSESIIEPTREGSYVAMGTHDLIVVWGQTQGP